jgi:hypothetical protein
MSSSGSAAFDALRSTLADDKPLRDETEAAFRGLLELYNPSDRGSRWVVGGVGEWIIAAAMYKAQQLRLPAGHDRDATDLVSPVTAELADVLAQMRDDFSVKLSFSPKVGSFRISNGMSGAGAGFVEPTVFGSPRLPGLVYANPVIHPDVAAHARDEKDAVTLSFGAVRDHAEHHPECVIALEIPRNPGRGTSDPSLDAARVLLSEGGRYPLLRGVFVDVIGRHTDHGLVAGIQKLTDMAGRGEITEQQKNDAIQRLISQMPTA